MAFISSGRSNSKCFPIFIKVIMDSRSDTTQIPPEFIRRLGRNLPDRVYLKLPNGKKLTEVELDRANGQTLMGRGWREFKHRLSLRFGHFLVFEYNGVSQFNVRICDTSAVEIDYPSDSVCRSDLLLEDIPTAARRRKVKVEDQGNDAADVIPDEDERPAKRTRLQKQNLSSGRHKKVPNTESSHPETRSRRRPVDRRVKREESTGHYGDSSVSRRAYMKEMSIAYQRAVAFGSRLNPHKTPFVVRFMLDSHVSYGFSLMIPFSFAGHSLLPAGANSVTLVTNRNEWSVKCIVSGKRVNVSAGWKGFVKDNGLKFGDVCIFKVANKSKQQPPVWNVIIFRS